MARGAAARKARYATPKPNPPPFQRNYPWFVASGEIASDIERLLEGQEEVEQALRPTPV